MAIIYPDPYTTYPEVKHTKEHVSGGHDVLNGLDVSQFITDSFKIIVPIPIPDSAQSGLAADSVAVNWTSSFKFKLNTQNLKAVRIRATWSASATDSVTEIDVVGSVSGTIVSVSGNAGTDAEGVATSGWSDWELITVQSQITTASATLGATYSISYVVVELEYGFA